MGTNQTSAGRIASSASPWLPWWPVALGLLALYVPTFYDLSQSIWNTEDQGHGPIILAVGGYLFWRARGVLLESPGKPAPLAGGVALGVGLLDRAGSGHPYTSGIKERG